MIGLQTTEKPIELEQQMQLLKQGESSALEFIYQNTRKAVFSICLTMLNNYASAEDMMQNTFLAVKKYASCYRDNTNPKAWINTVAKNLCLNELKKNKREVFVDFAERPELGSFSEMVMHDESGLIKMVLEKLSGEESRIVILHTLGGLQLKEIAELLQKPQGTVRWRYNTALKKLRKILKKEQGL